MLDPSLFLRSDMTHYSIPDLTPSDDAQAASNDDGSTFLDDFFDGVNDIDGVAVRILKEHFAANAKRVEKQMISDHRGEKRSVKDHHTFHGFDAAMKAAFPGWPENTAH